MYTCLTSKVIIENVQPNEYHQVIISQMEEGQNHRFSVNVDGKSLTSVINKNAEVYENLKVYASDPWSYTQGGWIRNLIIDHRGKQPFLNCG